MAKHQSFKLAAQELARTQPAVTLAIKQLEDLIGYKLLERTTRKVLPTVEGERFIPIAERLIRDFDVIVSDLTATADLRSGHVSLAVVPSVATRLLPDILKEFSELYPGISVHMTDDNSTGVQKRVTRNEVEIGIGSRSRQNKELQYQPLISDSIELICHRDHPLAGSRGPVRWHELQNHQFLESGIHDFLPTEALIRAQKFEFSTTTTLFAMIRANIGVTALPTLATFRMDPDLVHRPLIEPVVERNIYLITRKDRSLSPASQAMIEVLLSQISRILEGIGIPTLRSTINSGEIPDKA